MGRAAAEVHVFGTDLEYLCSSRALGDALNLHHLSAEGPDLMSSILWSVATSAINQQLCFCRHWDTQLLVKTFGKTRQQKGEGHRLGKPHLSWTGASLCVLPRAGGSSTVLPSGRMGSSRVWIAEAAWAALVARAHPRQWKCLLMWTSLPESSAPAPAAVLDGLESGVYRDGSCRSSL